MVDLTGRDAKGWGGPWTCNCTIHTLDARDQGTEISLWNGVGEPWASNNHHTVPITSLEIAYLALLGYNLRWVPDEEELMEEAKEEYVRQS